MKQLRIKSNKSFGKKKIAIILAILSLPIMFLVVIPIRGDSGGMGITTRNMIGKDNIVSELETNVFEGNVEITTPDLSYEGPAEFHMLEYVVSLQFNEELFNWNITRHTAWGCVESYLCYGNLGKLSVTILHTNCRTTLVAAGYQESICNVLFSGSAQINDMF